MTCTELLFTLMSLTGRFVFVVADTRGRGADRLVSSRSLLPLRFLRFVESWLLVMGCRMLLVVTERGVVFLVGNLVADVLDYVRYLEKEINNKPQAKVSWRLTLLLAFIEWVYRFLCVNTVQDSRTFETTAQGNTRT